MGSGKMGEQNVARYFGSEMLECKHDIGYQAYCRISKYLF